MKKFLAIAPIMLVTVMLFAALSGTASYSDEGTMGGQEVFAAQKCNMCHSVPSVGIESKTKSAAMKGPDLPTASMKDANGDRDTLLEYLRKEAEFSGKTHKKGASGSDEELNAVLDWLNDQETAKPD
jgi:cytochrome c2